MGEFAGSRFKYTRTTQEASCYFLLVIVAVYERTSENEWKSSWQQAEREVPKASGHIALQNIKAKIKSRREHQNWVFKWQLGPKAEAGIGTEQQGGNSKKKHNQKIK